MKKAIGYIRVSTEEQQKSGLSLEAQATKIENYCKTYDLDLLYIYQDTATARNMKRPGLESLLKDFNNEKADSLIISKLDRLTRNINDLQKLLKTYFKDNLTLHSVEEHIDTDSATGKMILNIMMSISEWEVDIISERTKSALKAKQQRGGRTGSIPYGSDLAPDGKILLKNKKEQKVIKTMQRLRALNLGYYSIANTLNADGLTTKRGKLWNQSNVSKVLKRNEKS